jgi:hypothetical protein
MGGPERGGSVNFGLGMPSSERTSSYLALSFLKAAAKSCYLLALSLEIDL